MGFYFFPGNPKLTTRMNEKIKTIPTPFRWKPSREIPVENIALHMASSLNSLNSAILSMAACAITAAERDGM